MILSNNFLADLSYNVFPWILLAFFAYFFFLLINLLFIFYNAKKNDPTLKHCLSTRGLICVGSLTVAYIAIFIYTIYSFIVKLNASGFMDAIQIVSLIAIATLIYVIQLQNIILVGKKSALIGNALFEYRKMKKIAYEKGNKDLTFVYSQKEIRTSLFFIDVPKLKTFISRGN